jgi:calcium-dependent protein kinase
MTNRDLKPENIIFANHEKDAPLKVIDFGTSRKFTNKNMTKRLGTVKKLNYIKSIASLII